MRVNFITDPSKYKHWKINVNGERADLILDVDEQGALFGGYELKLNSYDLGVDIELNDALQRLRFEYPAVKVVVIRSAKEKVFCAGANIKMLGGASHEHKVNFCKFTNETRNAIEDASQNSGQRYIAAVHGACAGGGYELALATEHIILVDDASSSVSLPEVALLAVLPGTGGITRVTDKRKIRRDRADIFCSTEEGARGQRALDWNLVDDLVPASRFEEVLDKRVQEFANISDRTWDSKGINLEPIQSRFIDDEIIYSTIKVEFKRSDQLAEITIIGPQEEAPAGPDNLTKIGSEFWPLRLARELDDAILQIRFNELEIAVISFKSEGDASRVASYCNFLNSNKSDWLIREIILCWTRVLKRVDLTSRSLVTLVTPESCFAGFLAELVFSADRSFMGEGVFDGSNEEEASIILTEANFGRHPMSNGLARLNTRFLGQPDAVIEAKKYLGQELLAEEAERLGIITMACDDIDWDDDIRLFLEERASFSPDALTGLEANTRFAGPETIETKIFGRLTAWQNWIFQRPNAVGKRGSLGLYGTGKKAEFDKKRV